MMPLRLFPNVPQVATVATQMPCRATPAPIRTGPLAGLRIRPIDQAKRKGSIHGSRSDFERRNAMKNKCMTTMAAVALVAVACIGLPGCSGGESQALRESVSQKLGTGSRAGETKTLALPDGATMEMVWCPPGSFTMGSPETEEGRTGSASRSHNERQHRVTLTKGFWMAKTEVTQKQWKSVMGKNPSKFKGDDLPVENVHWFDCRNFCDKSGLQIPTEAEWEYACRAGTKGAYAGTGRLDDMGWHSGNSGRRTHPVGEKAPNAWGLFDMHGNVSEWCWDYVDAYPDTAVTDPTGPAVMDRGRIALRGLRGGNWERDAKDCRSADRGGGLPRDRYGRNGFRPVARPD